jgi:hypothetical protein
MIKWREKLILAKTEVVYGTDPVPTGEANTMLMTDVALRPIEGTDVSRNLMFAYLGNQSSLLGDIHVVLEGTTEIAGSGTPGDAPAWGVLARACALAETIVEETSVKYSPVTDAHESATIYFWQGGTRHVMRGVRGSGVLTLNAQGIPVIRWTLTGLFTAPTDTAQATPAYDAWKKPLIVNDTNTPVFEIDDAPFVMRAFSMNIGNDVQPRMLVNAESVIVVDKAETINFTIDTVPLATFNPYVKAIAKTPIKIELTHGTVAGNICAIVAPINELERPTGFENDRGVTQWPLVARPIADAGDDQYSITLT